MAWPNRSDQASGSGIEGMSTGEVRPWKEEMEGFALSGGEAMACEYESMLSGEAMMGDSSKILLWLRGIAFINGGRRDEPSERSRGKDAHMSLDILGSSIESRSAMLSQLSYTERAGVGGIVRSAVRSGIYRLEVEREEEQLEGDREVAREMAREAIPWASKS